jgi:hypothetical protein
MSARCIPLIEERSARAHLGERRVRDFSHFERPGCLAILELEAPVFRYRLAAMLHLVLSLFTSKTYE